MNHLNTLNEILLLAYNRGWITTFDGNASFRSAQRDVITITPTGVRKNIMTEDHLINVPIQPMSLGIVDSCAQILQGFQGQELRPSGELPLHYALQRTINTSERWVIHVHATHIVAAMMAGFDLQRIAAEFGELIYTRVGPSVPVLPAQTNELGIKVAQCMQIYNDGSSDFDIVGIKQHGVVAMADDPWTAWSHIERLNHCCEVVLLCYNAKVFINPTARE
jgi:L-fuculose-phosphate aldolase